MSYLMDEKSKVHMAWAIWMGLLLMAPGHPALSQLCHGPQEDHGGPALRGALMPEVLENG